MSKHPSRMGLRQWIWRAFVQSALIPLVLVETILIACYLFSNQAVRESQLEYLERNAVDSLSATAEQNARIVQDQLGHIAGITGMFAQMTANALRTPAQAAVENLESTPDGVLFSPRDLGGAASFYSSATPPSRQDRNKLQRLALLDPLMREIKNHEPLVASLYFNSWDSYNRIYPWIRADEQYPHDMRIPEYNFYYLADATHNPQRGTRWTDVYLDPAGHGWMMSAIQPVYDGDFLEGVVGLDITVGGILEEIGKLKVPWGGYLMLVSDDMKIMALPPKAEHDFDLHELTAQDKLKALQGEHFKPDDFSLEQRADTRNLADDLARKGSGHTEVALRGRPHLVAWSEIQPAGWRLLAVADKNEVMAATNNLASHYRNIGYLMIVGLVVFYLGFFTFMWIRARTLSERLRHPIGDIGEMLQQIGHGTWHPQRAKSDIQELDDMAGDVLSMGKQLASSEAQRNAVQQHLNLVVESVTAGLWEYRLGDDCLRLHGEFCQRFNLADSELTRSAFHHHVHPEDIPALDKALDALRQGYTSRIDLELRLLRADGTSLWLLCRGRLIDENCAEQRVAAGTFVDIDTLKQVTEDLRRRTLEAQAASQAKSRFISSMSHELRTPLNAIYGFAQLLRMQADEQQADVQPLDEILGASEHLTHLVNDLLDWSSLQAKTQRLQLRAVEVSGLMRECAEMVRSQAEATGLHLSLQSAQGPLSVLADARRLRQVLLNLLSNAIKYNRPEGRLLMGVVTYGDRARLFVEDGGYGIAPELQHALYEPFQRLGKENTAIQGTGIGLALCHELAELMGGSMGLQSELDVGSRFWIELPIANANAARAASARPPRLCYVGDDDATLHCIEGVLWGMVELEAGTLDECLSQASSHGVPTILLVDCDGQGGELGDKLQQMRRLPGGDKLIVILLGSAPRSLMMLGCEFQAVLRQPLEPNELRELVSALLQQENLDVY